MLRQEIADSSRLLRLRQHTSFGDTKATSAGTISTTAARTTTAKLEEHMPNTYIVYCALFRPFPRFLDISATAATTTMATLLLLLLLPWPRSFLGEPTRHPSRLKSDHFHRHQSWSNSANPNWTRMVLLRIKTQTATATATATMMCPVRLLLILELDNEELASSAPVSPPFHPFRLFRRFRRPS